MNNQMSAGRLEERAQVFADAARLLAEASPRSSEAAAFVIRELGRRSEYFLAMAKHRHRQAARLLYEETMTVP